MTPEAELAYLRADVRAACEAAGTADVTGVGAAYAAGHLLGEREAWRLRAEAAEARVAALERLALALAARLAAAAEVLGRCAERGVLVRCRRCEACRGRGRFEMSPVCHWCAGSGCDLGGGEGWT